MADKTGTAQEALFAALPMYDWPEVSAAWDALWHAVRARLGAAGIDAQERLRRGADPEIGWLNPALLLGQTCGWPYVSRLRGKVVPIGRFDFGLPTARPGDYFSVFIMPANRAGAVGSPRDLAPLLREAGPVIAVNAVGSQSGFRVLGECLDGPLTAPPGKLLLTGGHRESIRAVAQHRAAFAAIDAVSWRLALAHEPMAKGVQVVCRSAEVPGLPLVIAADLARHADTVLHALKDSLAAMPGASRRALGLNGIVAAEDADYAVLTEPPFGNLRIQAS